MHAVGALRRARTGGDAVRAAGRSGPGGARIAERSLQDRRLEVRFLDYRNVVETNFDAVSSIGLTEHIGVTPNLGSYFSFLCGRSCAPEGRMLNHTITRPSSREQPRRQRRLHRPLHLPGRGAHKDRGRSSSAMHDHGLEVRHEENLREHYAMTLRDWCRNLERQAGTRRSPRWGSAWPGSGVSTSRARALSFERNRIQLHQVLASRTTAERRLRVRATTDLGELTRSACGGGYRSRRRRLLHQRHRAVTTRAPTIEPMMPLGRSSRPSPRRRLVSRPPTNEPDQTGDERHGPVDALAAACPG